MALWASYNDEDEDEERDVLGVVDKVVHDGVNIDVIKVEVTIQGFE